LSFNQSPSTGDFGFSAPGAQAARLMPSQIAPMEAIMIDRGQLPAVPLEDWGFESQATRDPETPIPVLSFGADMRSRFDVDFLTDDGERIGGFVFGDAHPDPWWDGVHHNGRLLIVVGDVSALVRSTTRDEQIRVAKQAYIGWAPLVIRAYSSGIGTAAPGQ
jgi:hypothetical protein